MKRVVHFEIHAEDPQRAVNFYSNVFGWDIKKWDNPSMDYWMIMTKGKDSDNEEKEKWLGIDGGLLIRKGPSPQESQPINAFVCTMDVENIDESITKIIESGGFLVSVKSAIPGVGWLAYAKDTEGNIFGIMQNDSEAK